MRIARTLLTSVFALPLVLVACGDDKKTGEDEPFDTLQDCYDDHHSGDEGLPIQQAIVVCCIEHPIGSAGEHPSCGATQPDCITHVRAELDPSVADGDITAACTDYVNQK
jgi:hypothetical protein